MKLLKRLKFRNGVVVPGALLSCCLVALDYCQLFPSQLSQLDLSEWNRIGSLDADSGEGTNALNTNPLSHGPNEFKWTWDVKAGPHVTMYQVAAVPASMPLSEMPGSAMLMNDTAGFVGSSPSVPLPPGGGVLAASVGLLGLSGYRRRVKSSATTATERFLGSGIAIPIVLLGCCLLALEFCI